jgi:hypothetical protein
MEDTKQPVSSQPQVRVPQWIGALNYTSNYRVCRVMVV